MSARKKRRESSAASGMFVCGWASMQHYSDRKPLWIKVYRTMLEDPRFGRLSLELRGALLMLWLIAADTIEGTLPSLPDLAWRMRLDLEKAEQLVTELIGVGFIGNGAASKLLAGALQVSSPEREKETEKRTETDTSPRKRGLSLDPRLRLGLLNGFSIEQVEAWAEAERALAPLWSKEVEGFSFDELLAFIRERFPERLVDPAFHTALSGCPRALAEMEGTA